MLPGRLFPATIITPTIGVPSASFTHPLIVTCALVGRESAAITSLPIGTDGDEVWAYTLYGVAKMPMATPVTQTASPMRLRKDNSDSIYFLSVSHAGHVPLQCPLKWQTLGSYAMPFMSAIFFLTAFSMSQIFLPPIHNITKFNLTKLHRKNGNSLVLLHYLTHQSQLDINRAVETFRSRCRACRRHRCHRCGVREGLLLIQVVFTKKVQIKLCVTGDDADGCCPQRKSPCPTLVGRKTNALSIKADSDGVHVNMFIQ